MTKPNPRHGEHVQREKPAAGKVDGSTAITPARNELPVEQEGEPPAQEPAMAQKYWIAILFWAVGFALMLLYEALGFIWRG
jgi:hypothetical protein